MNTLVIGYGNPLRGDDGVGSFVAKRSGPGAIACHQLTPELAEPISQADRVIFVDADVTVAPGRIRVRRLQPRPKAGIHNYDPEALLDLSRQVYNRVPEAILIGIGVQSFELCESLTPVAISAAGRAIRCGAGPWPAAASKAAPQIRNPATAKATTPSKPPAQHR